MGNGPASNLSAEIRSGLYWADLDVQARHEFSRKVAPYIELSRTFYPRAQSESGSGAQATTEVHAGMRLIF